MAKQRAFIHIDLPQSGGDLIDEGLRRHTGSLTDGRGRAVRLPAHSQTEMFRAAVELRRDHRFWGVRRRDVEGSWATLCRRAIKNKDTVVFSHHLLAGCRSDAIALMVDQLPGWAGHGVLTAAAPARRVAAHSDGYGVAAARERWSTVIRRPDRVHVIAADPARPEEAWHAFGDVTGIDTRSLGLGEPGEPEGLSAAARRPRLTSAS